MIGKRKTLMGALQVRHYWGQTSSLDGGGGTRIYRPNTYNAHRNKAHKWLMPYYMFPWSRYPYFLGGAGYLMAKGAAKCLLEASKVERLCD